jgi:hypothetical protein
MTTTASKRKRPARNQNARYEVWAGYPNPNPDRTGSSQYSDRKFEWAADAWGVGKGGRPGGRDGYALIVTHLAGNGGEQS